VPFSIQKSLLRPAPVHHRPARLAAPGITKSGWRNVLQERAIAFLGTAAFPRVSYWLRWPTRLGPRGVIVYAAFNTLVIFAMRTWGIRHLQRMAAKRERAEQELRDQLGRAPTEDEVCARLGSTCER
jgi:hypothetical protein